MSDLPDLTDLVADDEALRRRILGLFHDILDEFETTLDHGNTRDKVSLLRSAIPQLMKLVEHQQDEDEMSEMKDQLNALKMKLGGDADT